MFRAQKLVFKATTGVQTSVGQISFFHDTTWVYIMGILQYLILVEYGYMKRYLFLNHSDL